MRRPSVIMLLVGLLGGLALMQTLRPRVQAPQPLGMAGAAAGLPAAPPSADAGAEAATAGDPAAASSASGAAPAAVPAPAIAPPPRVVRLERALRVHGLGWPAMAGCVLANGGLEPSRSSLFPASELRVEMKSVAEPAELTRALARGGADEQGADAVVAPLAALVPLLDELASLRPTIVYASGWTRSRTTLVEPSERADESRSTTAPLVVDRSSSALVPSLYGMQLRGIDPRHAQILPRTTDPLPPGSWLAVSADAPPTAPLVGAHPVLAASAFGRLVPIVVITTEELLEQHEAALVGWLRGCMTGSSELAEAPPRAIRRLASFAGAPEPAELVATLATIEDCSLRDNLRLFGLAGRPVLDMGKLVTDRWALLHAAGLVAGPAPERPPLSDALVAAAARGRLPLTATSNADSQKPRRCPRSDDDSFELRLPPQPTPIDLPVLAQQVATLAAAGDGASVTVRLPSSIDPDRLLQWIGERFDVSLPCLSVHASNDDAETNVRITVRSGP